MNQEEPLPDILKLNINCFEELFEYLSFEDLFSVVKTCKRLQQITTYIVQQNYSGMAASCTENQRSGPFDQIVYEICMRTDFKPLFKIQSKFHGLQQINFIFCTIDATQIEIMTEIMNKVQFLRLDYCNIKGFIKQCSPDARI